MKRMMKLILCFCCVLALAGCQKQDNNTNNDENTDKTPVVVEPKKTSITLSFAGDVTLGNYVGQGYSGSFNH